ncbi:MAG: response regulator [Candidatus Limnocylindrales bacterium]
MNVFSALALVSFIAYLGLGIFVLGIDPRSRRNQVFCLMALGGAWWALGYVFMHSAPDQAFYLQWLNLDAYGWIVSPALVLHFFVLFTRPPELVHRRWFFWVIYLPVLPFLFRALTTTSPLDATVASGPLGWVEIPAFGSPWLFSYTAYAVSYVLWALLLCWLWTKRPSTSQRERRQARIVVGSGLVTLIALLVVKVVLPLFMPLPDVSALLVMIWAVGIGYAVAREKFMLLTPATAAEGILGTMSDPVLLIDDDGLTLLANQATLDLLGRSESDVVGRPWRSIFVDEEGIDLPGLLAGPLSAGPVRNVEMGLRARAGGTVPVMVSFSGIRNSEGRPLGMVAVCHDISERKRAEEERQALEAQMQRAQKLESLGVLAGGIAHDFNNLLTAMLGHTSLALEGMAPDAPEREDLGHVQEAAHRAAALCAQMLAYAGRGLSAREKVDLNGLTLEMTGMLQVSISKRATLVSNLAERLPPIEADASMISQVLINLITNASEALGDRDGTISVATSLRKCDRAYLSRSYLDEQLPEGNYVCLEVADNGCGMDAETLGRIFDPFFTTKFAGRGLGLAAVLGIVRGHAGALIVESQPGKGTTFQVLFPAAEPTTADVPPADDRERLKEGATVMFVDDEEFMRVLGRRLLRRLGFNVIEASNGHEAERLLQYHVADVACVILDLTMPGMDGTETLVKLRAIKPDLPVILSSGYQEDEARGRVREASFSAFMQKPYDASTLSALLGRVLEGATD